MLKWWVVTKNGMGQRSGEHTKIDNVLRDMEEHN